jgi:hypothetical protein
LYILIFRFLENRRCNNIFFETVIIIIIIIIIIITTTTTTNFCIGTLSLRVKRRGREVDNSPPSSAEVKYAWNYTSTPPIPLHGVVLS